jgi:hypothetical protein
VRLVTYSAIDSASTFLSLDRSKGPPIARAKCDAGLAIARACPGDTAIEIREIAGYARANARTGGAFFGDLITQAFRFAETCSGERNSMFKWLKARFARRSAEKRGREIFAAAEGSYVERCSIVGLMMAIEADEIAEQRGKLKPDGQVVFMMAYECCMMWAIKTGMGKVLKPEEVQSGVHTMQRNLAKNRWYQPGAFERIWAQMEILMPIAMSTEPGAPPPYPVAEMLMAPNLAGYPIDPMVGSDMKFGIYVLLMMQQLADAAELAAKEHLQGKKG